MSPTAEIFQSELLNIPQGEQTLMHMIEDLITSRLVLHCHSWGGYEEPHLAVFSLVKYISS